MPTMGGEFDHGLRADGEVAITGELGHQRDALHLDFEQGGVAEIILAGNLSQRCRGSVTGRRRDLDVLRTNRQRDRRAGAETVWHGRSEQTQR